jgi:hypothetical protein
MGLQPVARGDELPAHRTTVGARALAGDGSQHRSTAMAKGEQRSNKMVKKPKKDTSAPKESSSTSDRPMPPVTTVLPKGKLKNKQ